MASKVERPPTGKRPRSTQKSKFQAKRTSPHPVDLHVGMEVRRLRKAKGLTQIELAGSIGLTFQQVQKYERGANRISASKLLDIATFLEVPVAFFFSGLPGQAIIDLGTLASSPHDRRSDEAVALASRLGELPKHRRRLIAQLIEEMVAAPSKGSAGA